MNKEQLQEVKDTFPDADLSLIKEILYFDGWNSWDGHGGILIFKAIDDSIQIASYGSNVFSEDNENYFELEEISLEVMKKEIECMELNISENSLEG